MSGDEESPLPIVAGLHCRDCGRVRDCDDDQLASFIRDVSTWPRCCGVMMAVMIMRGDRGAGGKA